MSRVGKLDGNDNTVMKPEPCIDDFDVGQELGRGGFAVVYRARVRVSGLEVALKVVDKHRACELATTGGGGGGGGLSAAYGDDGGVGLACARVANEVRLHWGLKHPTVVELLDFFEDERFVYMVLELCGGGDLYRRLKGGGPLKEEEAAGYMGQLLAGLAYLHGRRVIHRDLKLSNLLLSRDGRRLRIADFGLAVKLNDDDHETHTICGTPNYMAPEVQDAGYGLAADLWSTGCLLYAMVTGGAPFQGRLVGETLSNARAGRYVDPEGLSNEAKDFLACMLELDPARRLSVEQAAAHPFLCLDKDKDSSKASPKYKRHPSKFPNSGITKSKTGKQNTTKRQPLPPAPHSPNHAQDALGSPSLLVKDKGKAGRAGVGGDHSPYCSPSSSLQSSPDGNRGKERGAGAGTMVGHYSSSTLTASTAILGSDRCSLNSSLMEDNDEDGDNASFFTLRAEAVPTPATIGKGTAAAAARVRRAAARAPFRGNLSTEASAYISGKRSSAAGVTAADGQGRDSALAYIGKSGHNAAGYGSQGGTGGSRSRPVDSVAGTDPRREGNVNSGGGVMRKVEEVEDGLGSDNGGSEGRKVDVVTDGVGVDGGSRRGRFGGEVGVPAAGVGAAAVWSKSAKGNYVAHEQDIFGDRESDVGLGQRRDAEKDSRRIGAPFPSGTTAGSGIGASMRAAFAQNREGITAEREYHGDLPTENQPSVNERSSKKDPQYQHRRRRARQRQKQDNLALHDAHAVAGTADDTRRRDDRRYHQVHQNGFPNTSDDSWSSPSSPRRTRPNRRRQRPTRRRSRDRDGAIRPSPPPPRPFLPPHPPPLPGDNSSKPASSEASSLNKLRALRDAAVAERRAHDPCGAVVADHSPTKAFDTSHTLIPLSTARVKPVSHGLGGKAAVEVLVDGRAKITVGRRWLISSPDGERVWFGSDHRTGKYAGGDDRATRTASNGPVEERSLESLPPALHPLYRSLAGIVDALRSKTSKVILRPSFETYQMGGAVFDTSDRRLPAGLVSCALMDNLPEPDFAAAFQDGASLSLWTRKGEVRVELPCGHIQRWPVGFGSEWPGFQNDMNGDQGHRGKAVDHDETGRFEPYLDAGLRGYCMCLREEAAAYRKGTQFPVEIGVGERGVFAGGDGADTGEGRRHQGHCVEGEAARERHWWRGDDDSSSNTSSCAEGSLRLDADRSTSAAADDSLDDAHGDGRVGYGTALPNKGHARVPRDGYALMVEHEGRHVDESCQDSPVPSRTTDPGAATLTEQAKHSVTSSTAASRSSEGHDALFSAPLSPSAAKVYNSKRGGDNDGRTLDYGGGDRRTRSAPRFPRAVVESSHNGPATATPAESLSSAVSCSSFGPEVCTLKAVAGEGNVYSGGGDGGGDSVASSARGWRENAAMIPGVGRAVRDSRGDLKVIFGDGVVVVVDANAKWMRVQESSPAGKAAPPVSYDLRKDSTGKTRKDGVGGGARGPRMPRDVKERMKALPRFISILKTNSETGRSKEAEDRHGSIFCENGR